KDFTVSSLGRDEDGIFTATITGLDRNKARDTVISCMTAQLGSLIKYLSDIRSVRAAENK
ncbi:MAG: hypothetical protein IKO93_12140, partial [Lentisphaeria bacterium]|nr:hypothetical protein [Lentisphaeria bacterium]